MNDDSIRTPCGILKYSPTVVKKIPKKPEYVCKEEFQVVWHNFIHLNNIDGLGEVVNPISLTGESERADYNLKTFILKYKDRFTEKDMDELALCVCKLVSSVHAKDISCSSLKPENILIFIDKSPEPGSICHNIRVKLSDLHSYLLHFPLDKSLSYLYFRSCLYNAPESYITHPHGSIEGDYFALALIIRFIYCHAEAFTGLLEVMDVATSISVIRKHYSTQKIQSEMSIGCPMHVASLIRSGISPIIYRRPKPSNYVDKINEVGVSHGRDMHRSVGECPLDCLVVEVKAPLESDTAPSFKKSLSFSELYSYAGSSDSDHQAPSHVLRHISPSSSYTSIGDARTTGEVSASSSVIFHTPSSPRHHGNSDSSSESGSIHHISSSPGGSPRPSPNAQGKPHGSLHPLTNVSSSHEDVDDSRPIFQLPTKPEMQAHVPVPKSQETKKISKGTNKQLGSSISIPSNVSVDPSDPICSKPKITSGRDKASGRLETNPNASMDKSSSSGGTPVRKEREDVHKATSNPIQTGSSQVSVTTSRGHSASSSDVSPSSTPREPVSSGSSACDKTAPSINNVCNPFSKVIESTVESMRTSSDAIDAVDDIVDDPVPSHGRVIQDLNKKQGPVLSPRAKDIHSIVERKLDDRGILTVESMRTSSDAIDAVDDIVDDPVPSHGRVIQDLNKKQGPVLSPRAKDIHSIVERKLDDRGILCDMPEGIDGDDDDEVEDDDSIEDRRVEISLTYPHALQGDIPSHLGETDEFDGKHRSSSKSQHHQSSGKHRVGSESISSSGSGSSSTRRQPAQSSSSLAPTILGGISSSGSASSLAEVKDPGSNQNSASSLHSSSSTMFRLHDLSHNDFIERVVKPNPTLMHHILYDRSYGHGEKKWKQVGSAVPVDKGHCVAIHPETKNVYSGRCEGRLVMYNFGDSLKHKGSLVEEDSVPGGIRSAMARKGSHNDFIERVVKPNPTLMHHILYDRSYGHGEKKWKQVGSAVPVDKGHCVAIHPETKNVYSGRCEGRLVMYNFGDSLKHKGSLVEEDSVPGGIRSAMARKGRLIRREQGEKATHRKDRVDSLGSARGLERDDSSKTFSSADFVSGTFTSGSLPPPHHQTSDSDPSYPMRYVSSSLDPYDDGTLSSGHGKSSIGKPGVSPRDSGTETIDGLQLANPAVTYTHNRSTVMSVKVCGSTVFSGGMDGTVRIWDSLLNFSRVLCRCAPVHAISVDSKYRMESGGCSPDISEHQAAIVGLPSSIHPDPETAKHSLIRTPNDGILAVGTRAGVVHLMSLNDDHTQYRFSFKSPILDVHTRQGIHSLIRTPNDGILAVGTRAGVVHLMSLNDDHTQYRFSFKSPILDVHTRQGIVCSGSIDRYVRVWDVHTGQQIMNAKKHKRRVRCVRVFEHGKMIVSGSHDQQVRLWDMRYKKSTHVLRCESEVSGVVARGHGLLASCQDGSVVMWDNRQTKKRISTISVHEGKIKGIDWIDDLVATVSDDMYTVVLEFQG
ncbi:hypothetical protein ADUPG1_013258 [Aduncisulcus paluster]|uniref:Protein kinase domain-containing protein n=1 Tax=Aduncisulcus paluster TaxID=2918883 RepID=A0ABQ5K442_9EUKA|nr:hypothetical protein ADUPG1_013258 [Aduncisulcus paluster]